MVGGKRKAAKWVSISMLWHFNACPYSSQSAQIPRQGVAWLLAINIKDSDSMRDALCQGGLLSPLGRVRLEEVDPRRSSNGHQEKYP